MPVDTAAAALPPPAVALERARTAAAYARRLGDALAAAAAAAPHTDAAEAAGYVRAAADAVAWCCVRGGGDNDSAVTTVDLDVALGGTMWSGAAARAADAGVGQLVAAPGGLAADALLRVIYATAPGVQQVLTPLTAHATGLVGALSALSSADEARLAPVASAALGMAAVLAAAAPVVARIGRLAGPDGSGMRLLGAMCAGRDGARLTALTERVGEWTVAVEAAAVAAAPSPADGAALIERFTALRAKPYADSTAAEAADAGDAAAALTRATVASPGGAPPPVQLLPPAAPSPAAVAAWRADLAAEMERWGLPSGDAAGVARAQAAAAGIRYRRQMEDVRALLAAPGGNARARAVLDAALASAAGDAVVTIRDAAVSEAVAAVAAQLRAARVDDDDDGDGGGYAHAVSGDDDDDPAVSAALAYLPGALSAMFDGAWSSAVPPVEAAAAMRAAAPSVASRLLLDRAPRWLPPHTLIGWSDMHLGTGSHGAVHAGAVLLPPPASTAALVAVEDVVGGLDPPGAARLVRALRMLPPPSPMAAVQDEPCAPGSGRHIAGDGSGGGGGGDPPLPPGLVVGAFGLCDGEPLTQRGAGSSSDSGTSKPPMVRLATELMVATLEQARAGSSETSSFTLHLPDALALLRDVAAALAVLHGGARGAGAGRGGGLAHGSVRTSSVMLDRAGRARLAVAQVIATPAHLSGGGSTSSAPADYHAPELRWAAGSDSGGGGDASRAGSRGGGGGGGRTGDASCTTGTGCSAPPPPPTPAGDVYAWASLAAEVLSWVRFDDDGARPRTVARPPLPPALTPDADALLPPGTPPAVTELVRQCWDGRPGIRPSAAVLAQQMGDALARRTGDRGHACCVHLGAASGSALAALDARAAEAASAAGYAYAAAAGGAGGVVASAGSGDAADPTSPTLGDGDADGVTHFTAARAHPGAATAAAAQGGGGAHTAVVTASAPADDATRFSGRDHSSGDDGGTAGPAAVPAPAPRSGSGRVAAPDAARLLRKRQQREEAALAHDQRHAAEWQFSARLAGADFGRPSCVQQPRATGWRRLLCECAGGGSADGHTRAITGVAGLPGGLLATCSEDGDVKVWRLPPPSPSGSDDDSGGGRRLNLLSTLPSDGGPLAALLALPRGLLLGLQYNGALWAWAVTGTGVGVSVGTLPGGRGSDGEVTVNSPLAVLGDGRLAIHDGAGRLVLWRLSDGAGFVRDPTTAPIEVGTGLDDVIALRDGRLATSDATGCISVWAPPLEGDVDGGAGSEGAGAAWELDAWWTAHACGGVSPLLALPDGSLVSCGDADCAVRRWVHSDDSDPGAAAEENAAAGGWRRVGTISEALDARGESAVALLPVDGRLAIASPSGGVKLWAPTVDDGDADHGFRHDGGLLVGGGDDWPAVLTMTALADGRLVAGCKDGSVRIWR